MRWGSSDEHESAPASSPLDQNEEYEVEVTYFENTEPLQQTDGQESAPASGPLYQSKDEEIEVTYENSSSLVAAIKKEEGKNTVPQTPPNTQQPKTFDPAAEQSIHERSLNQLHVKERVGRKQYDSPPRQSIQERRVSSSREESLRRTTAKERLGKRPASSGQENPHQSNKEPRRNTKRTRDLQSQRQQPVPTDPKAVWAPLREGAISRSARDLFWFPRQTRRTETDSE